MSSWDEEYAAREERWDAAIDSDDPMLPGLSDRDIEGVCDGYDDFKLDTVFMAYTSLRVEVKSLRQRCIDEGIISD